MKPDSPAVIQLYLGSTQAEDQYATGSRGTWSLSQGASGTRRDVNIIDRFEAGVVSRDVINTRPAQTWRRPSSACFACSPKQRQNMST
ncbi:hypothetical protein AMELA_G00003720 [Ameiurus melas]|uniref:Uncharacterized protein n=1 Tax=Ameiurus melas TaxID=219545 RepID=A0A7J6BEQ8_AMEME|nr:hypothetical protein AMELA_G00003720 [Ameiurus melas]